MKYNDAFFKGMNQVALRAAEKIVPIIMENFNPESVIDFGTGHGVWLSIFKEMGVNKVRGCDGDYVDRERLWIHKDEFQAIDLNSEFSINEKYDLAMSIEVVEHLNEQAALSLVEKLTKASDTIMFSAAAPFQGGTGHINEKPLSYWIEEFNEQGFEAYDFLRPLIWYEKEINPCYRQNIIMFFNKSKIDLHEKFMSKIQFYGRDLVHPGILEYRNSKYRRLLSQLFNKQQYILLLDLLKENSDPDSMEIYYLGRVYKELNEKKLAVDYLEDYLLYGEKEYLVSTYFHLGECLLELNILDEALEYFEKCLHETDQKHKLAAKYKRHIQEMQRN